MATKISRRKLASWTAKQLAADNSAQSVMRRLGAFLIDTRRTNEQSLIVRDVEIALLKEGSVLVSATSARPLSTEAIASIEAFVRDEYGKDAKVIIEQHIDESVIGGVRLMTPNKQIDATIRTKLEKLTA
jgi:F0F1-type ATP synthase delta subunit